jgi:UDP-N-acetylglucosamine transferase subunit ALG13
MIFVTIGTTEPFERLLGTLDSLGEDEELVVQCGDSGTRPRRATCVDYVSFDELVAHIRKARVVVSHAGVGTIMAAITEGKRPIVVPRRSALGEAVDDHQVHLARRLDELGLVTCVEDTATLAEIIRSAPPVAPPGDQVPSELVAELRDFVDTTVRRGSEANRRARFR